MMHHIYAYLSRVKSFLPKTIIRLHCSRSHCREMGGPPSAAQAPDAQRRLTKNERRRQKEKLKPAPSSSDGSIRENGSAPPEENGAYSGDEAPSDDLGPIQIEYVSAVDALTRDAESNLVDAASVEQFKSIFQKFAKPEELTSSWSETSATNEDAANGTDAAVVALTDGGSGEMGGGEGEDSKKLSKKKMKLLSRFTVAELKQLVQHPDVIEAHDVTSSDPKLLVYLKGLRNTVPVPRHWSHKSKYLQRKRGIEKPPFKLPEFIADTGIAKIRDSILEQESLQKSKSKARGRVQPKMGKIDIDYQVLHDAFFKFQTKPKLTGHGDLYYEGKEFESGGKDYKAGHLSKGLLAALGMEDNQCPPPWLTNMQRYGPPPSYPTLRIPGLNAPIPKDASFGYHTGGWGKPPVDEYGRPIYGDVFGAYVGIDEGDEIVDKVSRWGEVVAVEDEDEEDDDDDDDDDEDGVGDDEDVPHGETPEDEPEDIQQADTDFGNESVVDLRKRATAAAEEPAKELYRVIQEKQASVSDALFGSAKVYSVNNGTASVATEKAGGTASMVSKAATEDGDKSKRKRGADGEQATKKFKESFKF